MNINTTKKLSVLLSILTMCASVNAGSYMPTTVLSDKKSGIIVALSGALAAAPYIAKHVSQSSVEDVISPHMIACAFGIAACVATPVGLFLNQLSVSKQEKRSKLVINTLKKNEILQNKEMFEEAIKKMGKKVDNNDDFHDFATNFCADHGFDDVFDLYTEASRIKTSLLKEEQRITQVIGLCNQAAKEGNQTLLNNIQNDLSLMQKICTYIKSLTGYAVGERASLIRSKFGWMSKATLIAAIFTSPLVIIVLRSILNKFGIPLDLSSLLPGAVRVDFDKIELTIV